MLYAMLVSGRLRGSVGRLSLFICVGFDHGFVKPEWRLSKAVIVRHVEIFAFGIRPEKLVDQDRQAFSFRRARICIQSNDKCW